MVSTFYVEVLYYYDKPERRAFVPWGSIKRMNKTAEKQLVTCTICK